MQWADQENVHKFKVDSILQDTFGPVFHLFRGILTCRIDSNNECGFKSPFRLDPRGWEPHFVATEWRPQGALLTSWQNPTFTEEGFCHKMAVQADP